MNTNSVKQTVVDSYGKLAEGVQNQFFSKLFSCCDTTDNANQVGEAIGYSKKELDAVPEHSNLGVGCGNPSGMADIREGDTVVDLGSGAGFDAFLVSPMVGNSGKVIGVDLSDKMLALARKNAKTSNYENVEFVKGDIEELPLESSVADHVISNCVINLSLDKGAVYEEAFRILRKGGQLSVSDIVLEEELPDFIANSLSGHIACVSGAEKLEIYLQHIEQAGFKEMLVREKSTFPLELMLGDPQVKKLAQELDFDLGSDVAIEMASRVKSVSITAKKL